MDALVRSRSLLAMLFGAAGLAARAADAQNLLANPGFSEVLGLSPWTVESGVAAWDDLQCPGFAPLGSGSARLDYDTAASGNPTTRVAQCLAVEPGSVYELTGSVFIPADTAGVEAALVLRFVDGTCESGVPLGYHGGIETDTGDCFDVAIDAIAPDHADAVVASLEVTRTTSSTAVTAYFDDVSLRNLPEPAAALSTWIALAALTGLRRGRPRRCAARAAAARPRTRRRPPTPRAA